jgi:hypothetical protein
MKIPFIRPVGVTLNDAIRPIWRPYSSFIGLPTKRKGLELDFDVVSPP